MERLVAVKHDTCSPGYCGVYNDTGRDGTGEDGNCIKQVSTTTVAILTTTRFKGGWMSLSWVAAAAVLW